VRAARAQRGFGSAVCDVITATASVPWRSAESLSHFPCIARVRVVPPAGENSVAQAGLLRARECFQVPGRDVPGEEAADASGQWLCAQAARQRPAARRVRPALANPETSCVRQPYRPLPSGSRTSARGMERGRPTPLRVAMRADCSPVMR
jgi:hypothetical protein